MKYPTQAQHVADTEDQEAAKIQAAVSKEKIDFLQKFLGHTDSKQTAADIKQMLSDEKQKLQSTTTKLGNELDGESYPATLSTCRVAASLESILDAGLS